MLSKAARAATMSQPHRLVPMAVARPLAVAGPVSDRYRASSRRAVSNIVVGVAAVVTEKVAGKVLDKVAEQTAEKVAEAATAVLDTVTGSEESAGDGHPQSNKGATSNKASGPDEHGANSNSGNTSKTWSASTTLHRLAGMLMHPVHVQQARTITTRTSTKATPQRDQQPYDYKPNASLSDLKDKVGPEAMHDATQRLTDDTRDTASGMAASDTAERIQRNAENSPLGSESTRQLKDTMSGFTKELAGDSKDVIADTKHEWAEVKDTVREMAGDAAHSTLDTLGGAADKVRDMFGASADRATNMAGGAADKVRDTLGGAAEKASDIASNAPEKVRDMFGAGADKVRDTLGGSADQPSGGTGKVGYGMLGGSTSSSSSSSMGDKLSGAAAGWQARGAAESVRESLGTAKDRAVNATHDMMGGAAGMANEAIDRTAEATNDMRGAAQSAVNQAKDAARGAADKAKKGAEFVADQAQDRASSMTDAAKGLARDAGDMMSGATTGRAHTVSPLTGVSDEAPEGHSINDLLDEAEDKLRGSTLPKSRL